MYIKSVYDKILILVSGLFIKHNIKLKWNKRHELKAIESKLI